MTFLHQASERTIQSLVRPHWLSALVATVNLLTSRAQIKIFVMAVTWLSTWQHDQLRLIAALARQIGGTVDQDSSNQGTTMSLIFPVT